jgi:hypothetical protein
MWNLCRQTNRDNMDKRENSLFPVSRPTPPTRPYSFRETDLPFEDRDNNMESKTTLPFELIIIPIGAKEYAEAFLMAEGYRIVGLREPKQLSLLKPHEKKTQ